MSAETLAYLRSPKAIRDRTRQIFALSEASKTHFDLHLNKLDEVSQFVAAITLERYPELKIPFHSRWGHFQVGGVDRMAKLEGRLRNHGAAERARAKLDLAITSVLLDAGSGPGWKFIEPGTGVTYARSEGLAVASLHLFTSGALSSDPRQPLQADAEGLRNLTRERLAEAFQVTAENPLAGMEGRHGLLVALGNAVAHDSRHFPHGGSVPRPGHIFDFCANTAGASREMTATRLLLAVLEGLGPIWPGRLNYEGTNLGDVWAHPELGDPHDSESWVPFHKLSQWMTYSLIEPIEDAGVKITEVTGLTGLAEYRNGGLMIDRQLITLKDPAMARRVHAPSSPLVIEWRALTLILLEQIADRVRKQLGQTPEQMPLAKVLEGGTWHAGRKAAAALRPDGSPPLQIESDGTVF